jgi:hypothetical protein
VRHGKSATTTQQPCHSETLWTVARERQKHDKHDDDETTKLRAVITAVLRRFEGEKEDEKRTLKSTGCSPPLL